MANSNPSGVGIGLRREFAGQVAALERQLDWLEIIPENFIHTGGPLASALDPCRERFAVAAHGVTLNLGGPDPLDTEHIANLKRLLDRIGAPGFSEHLCWSRTHGHQTFDLMPLPFTEEAVKWVAGRIRQVQDQLDRQILVENVSTYALMPGATLTEGEFHHAVVEEAGCGLLLDVNNVFVNAKNHGTDPLTSLLAMPIARAGQIHVAGHCESTTEDGEPFLVDDHGAPVKDEVWMLLEEAVARRGPIPVLLEWDTHVPPLTRVLDEADAARAVVERALARFEANTVSNSEAAAS